MRFDSRTPQVQSLIREPPLRLDRRRTVTAGLGIFRKTMRRTVLCQPARHQAPSSPAARSGSEGVLCPANQLVGHRRSSRGKAEQGLERGHRVAPSLEAKTYSSR